jgi:hypothetical protein
MDILTRVLEAFQPTILKIFGGYNPLEKLDMKTT